MKETKTKKDYLDLLEETVNYYSEDTTRRSTQGGLYGCSYYSKDSKGVERMCAVGRCLTNPKDKDSALVDLVIDGVVESTGVETLLKAYGDVIFKPKYRGFDSKIWEEIQGLHDMDYYWNYKEGRTLTILGRMKIAKIKTLINNIFKDEK